MRRRRLRCYSAGRRRCSTRRPELILPGLKVVFGPARRVSAEPPDAPCGLSVRTKIRPGNCVREKGRYGKGVSHRLGVGFVRCELARLARFDNSWIQYFFGQHRPAGVFHIWGF